MQVALTPMDAAKEPRFSEVVITDKMRRYTARCLLDGIPEADTRLGPIIVDTRSEPKIIVQIHDAVVAAEPAQPLTGFRRVNVIYTPGGLGAIVLPSDGFTFSAFLDAAHLRIALESGECVPVVHDIRHVSLVPVMPTSGVYAINALDCTGFKPLYAHEYPSWLPANMPIERVS